MSTRTDSLIAELMRVLIVIFGAAVGLQLSSSITTTPDRPVLGILTAPMIGVIVGAGLGYSLGGVISRRIVGVLDRSDQALDGITPEELVSGSIGGAAAAALAAIVLWPLFLLTTPLIAMSLFALAVVVAGAFGFTVARRRRVAVMEAVGPRTGVASGARRSKGSLVDSSVAIDGRLRDVAQAGFLSGTLVVCQPVLDELQSLADSSDDRRRDKGRRGLATLDELRRMPMVSVTVIDDEAPETRDVDAKLVAIARRRELALLTTDTALAKIAEISGVSVQNLHALSLALRPPIAVGDTTSVGLIRAGREAGQAVGYLDDGTMMVVDQGLPAVGSTVVVEVTSVLTTSNGRMAFARIQGEA